MSGKSGASGSVRSCAGSVRLHASTAGHEVVLDALYERKRDKKTVRVLTVIIYVFCVSLAAIMLSLYYVFFWEPKDAQYAQRKVAHTVEKQTTTTPMPTCFMPHTGGSNTTVSDNATLALANGTEVYSGATDAEGVVPGEGLAPGGDLDAANATATGYADSTAGDLGDNGVT